MIIFLVGDVDPEGQTLVQVGKGALAAGGTGTGRSTSSCIVVGNEVDRPTQLSHKKCPTRVGT